MSKARLRRTRRVIDRIRGDRFEVVLRSPGGGREVQIAKDKTRPRVLTKARRAIVANPAYYAAATGAPPEPYTGSNTPARAYNDTIVHEP